MSSSRALSGSILLANHKDLKDVSLDSVRMLLLDDGANPCKFQGALAFVCNTQYTISMQHTLCDFGCVCDFTAGSLASSDLFYDAYGPKGLAREALCPCAGSPETLTVSVRRWLPILKYDSIGIAFFMLPLPLLSSSLLFVLPSFPQTHCFYLYWSWCHVHLWS